MKILPISSMILSLVVAIGGSPLVLAVSPKATNIQITEKQPIKLAQFNDAGSSEQSELIQEANALYKQGDLPGAESKLRKLIKKYPKDAFGHFQLGNILLEQKQPEAAIESYQVAVRLKPKYALAYNAMGVAYATQSRWDEAITAYRKALEINPNYGDAMTNLGQVLWQVNRRDEAVASLEKALNIFKSQSRNEKVLRIEQMLKQIRSVDDPSLS